MWKKWCIKLCPINDQTNNELNYKEAFINLMLKSRSFEKGDEFKSYNICPAEMNAMACYRNIIATGNDTNSKFTNVYTNNQTLSYQIIH